MPSDDLARGPFRVIAGEDQGRTNPFDLKPEDVKVLSVDDDNVRVYTASMTISLGANAGKVTADYWEPIPVEAIKDRFIRNEITARCLREAKRQLMTVEEKLK
jgi:hypothetical protein